MKWNTFKEHFKTVRASTYIEINAGVSIPPGGWAWEVVGV